MGERNPLTLEELRNAYEFSERVGLHVLIQFDSCKCEYEGVIDHRDDDGICAVYAASGEWLKEKDYGKTWVAYAAEPPRLDRSEWEPCENCGLKCRVCFRNGTDRCKKCKNHDLYIPFSHFCQCCGRPLTDAAWEMLERRLAGLKDCEVLDNENQ